jgi:hypothetical protein
VPGGGRQLTGVFDEIRTSGSAVLAEQAPEPSRVHSGVVEQHNQSGG